MTLSLIERAQKSGNPLIEGQTATLVWQGKNPPKLTGDFTGWHQGKPVEMEARGEGIWAYSLELPGDAYIEYIFLDGDKRITDPLNKHTAINGIGKLNNYFYMPKVGPTPLARRKKGVPKGQVIRQVIDTQGYLSTSQRQVEFYRPASDVAVPLLVVWDGADYRRLARLPVLVDNLVAQGRIRPLALAMVQNGGVARRVEYSCNDATLSFLQSCVLPAAHKLLNLVSEPGAHGALGASMGGLMALYTAYRLPHLFGHVLSQSGAFTIDGVDMVLFDLVQNSPLKPLKVWMDVGRYDFGSLVKANPRMHKLLLERGYDVTFREYPAGHNYPAWRNDVWRGLEHLYGIKPSETTE